MVDTGVLFVSYSAFQNVIRNFTHPGYDPSSPPSLSLSQLSLAAASAGLAHSFILYVAFQRYHRHNAYTSRYYRTPVELVKCKMQVQMLNSDYAPAHSSLTKPHTPTTIMTSIRKMSTFPASNTRKHPATIIGGSTIPLVVPPGPVAIVRNTLQTHGFTGLYLGHTGTMLRETGGTAVWFAVKEYTAQLLQEHRLGAAFNREAVSESTLLPWESAASGALAGAVCVVALYPVDTVKNAMQTQEELSSKRSKPLIHDSFWRTTTRMYHQHGMRGLYAGCGMTVARTVPSSGLVFLVYDVLSASFGA